MRARYYDTNTGRFLSRDPIGFEGGDLNLYAYIGGNPMVGIDPSGLEKDGIEEVRSYTDTDQFGYPMWRIETTYSIGTIEITWKYCNWRDRLKAVARLTKEFGVNSYKFFWDNFRIIRVLNEFNKPFIGPFLDPSSWDSFEKEEMPNPLPFGIKQKAPKGVPA